MTPAKKIEMKLDVLMASLKPDMPDIEKKLFEKWFREQINRRGGK
jgi:hypothetical protein